MIRCKLKLQSDNIPRSLAIWSLIKHQKYIKKKKTHGSYALDILVFEINVLEIIYNWDFKFNSET